MYDCEKCGNKHWSLKTYAACTKPSNEELERLANLAYGCSHGIVLSELRDMGLYTGKCYSGAAPRQWAGMAPTTVDISTITEYGMTQKLSNQIRVF